MRYVGVIDGVIDVIDKRQNWGFTCKKVSFFVQIFGNYSRFMQNLLPSEVRFVQMPGRPLR